MFVIDWKHLGSMILPYSSTIRMGSSRVPLGADQFIVDIRLLVSNSLSQFVVRQIDVFARYLPCDGLAGRNLS